MTKGVDVVEGLGVMDARLDRLGFVELLAGGTTYRALDGMEEGPETGIMLLV